ncbi:MAG: hypothetical protein HY779_05380 [Rubrobacteridae bacterium]|nr:hypothetical protein [Rubrobacteridae bacterium]
MFRKIIAFAVITMLLLPGVAMANGDRVQDRKRDKSCTITPAVSQAKDTVRDRKKDGSCLTTAAIQKQDRKKDGSCTTLAKDMIQDRKKDGSCLSA